MKAKALIVVILSAALIWSIPKTDTPEQHIDINNRGNSVTAKSVARANTKVRTVATKESAREIQTDVSGQTTPQTTSSAEPAAVAIPQTPPPNTHEQLMSQAGIEPEDYGAADYIISHESSWQDSATEPNSGAYGLCQSLPAIKMATAGSDWQTNPVTQLKWCNSYAVTRYGGWQGAYAHWTVFRWW